MQKWPKKFIIFYLQQILVSAFLLYKHTTKQDITMTSFWEQIYEEIVPIIALECQKIHKTAKDNQKPLYLHSKIQARKEFL